MEENGLEKLQRLAVRTFQKAQLIEDRRKRGIARLKAFSLLTRILKFNRFKKIRSILKRQEMVRSHLVIMAVGMTRKVRQIKRKNAGRN